MMQRLTCAFVVLALVSGVRVDDEVSKPADSQQQQARQAAAAVGKQGRSQKSDAQKPQTIEAKAGQGSLAAAKALAEAKAGLKLAGPPPDVKVPAEQIKQEKDEAMVGDWFEKQRLEKQREELAVADGAAAAATAKAEAAATKLKACHEATNDAQDKQADAEINAHKADMKHDEAESEKNKGDAIAMGSAMSAAGANKVLETSKAWKDESDSNLAEKKESAEDLKSKADLAEAKLEHVYGLNAVSNINADKAKSDAKDAEQKASDASAKYDAAYALHSKLLPIVASTASTAHAASEAEAVATDKAFASAHQVEQSKIDVEKAEVKAQTAKEDAEGSEIAAGEIEQAKKVKAAEAKGAAAADAAQA